MESITETSIQLCEGNCLSDVGAINRFSDEQLLSKNFLMNNVFFFVNLIQNLP